MHLKLHSPHKAFGFCNENIKLQIFSNQINKYFHFLLPFSRVCLFVCVCMCIVPGALCKYYRKTTHGIFRIFFGMKILAYGWILIIKCKMQNAKYEMQICARHTHTRAAIGVEMCAERGKNTQKQVE